MINKLKTNKKTKINGKKEQKQNIFCSEEGKIHLKLSDFTDSKAMELEYSHCVDVV